MKKQTKLLNISVMLFAVVTALFLLFFLYVNHYESIDIYRARESRSYAAVEAYSLEQIADETAPAGVRNVYRWTQEIQTANDTCLTILTVHQSVEVYFDDALVYSMAPSEGNRIAGSTGTYWSTIPLYPSDNGTQITVIVTPLFANVIDYGAEFWCGSQFSTLFGQLFQEIPQLLTAILCMVLGAFIILVQVYFSLTADTQTWDMFFLGSFAILLGLWRLTYADTISILFPDNSMTLGYITIGALFLVIIPMAPLSSTLARNNKMLLVFSCLCSVISLMVLLLQVLGILELKEMLTVCHILLVAALCIIFAAMWRQRKLQNHRKNRRNPFSLIGVGIVMDLLSFYLNETASDVFFTILAFIVYAIIVFISRATETSHKAYTDSHTGLANRLRWNELMKEDSPIPEPFGILLMDLNGLKQVNDSLGHDMGDRVIFHFSNILRNTLPASSIICRWGGDEFAILLTGISRRQLDGYIQALLHATETHNAENHTLPIHFAAGSALSAEHPSMTRTELFHLADEEMYRDKQLWYAEKTSDKK